MDRRADRLFQPFVMTTSNPHLLSGKDHLSGNSRSHVSLSFPNFVAPEPVQVLPLHEAAPTPAQPGFLDHPSRPVQLVICRSSEFDLRSDTWSGLVSHPVFPSAGICPKRSRSVRSIPPNGKTG